MENLNFTELEQRVIDNLKGCDEFDGYPQSCVEQISDELGESTKTIRGVISSLVKKEVVQVEDLVQGCPPFVLLIKNFTVEPVLPEAWKSSQREDLALAHKMVEAGYGVQYTNVDTMHNRIENPTDSINFVKGSVYVWRAVGRWVRADLIGGHFKNHERFDSLEDYLKILVA